MFELRIKNQASVWAIADMGDDKPAMNFQVNNIGELKDRNNAYSQMLKLPKSPTNCQLFNHVDVFDSTASDPYNTFECRLFYNSRDIAPIKAKLCIHKISKYFFECQITAGNADIFEVLKNSPMSSLDLGYFLRDYDDVPQLGRLDSNNQAKFYTGAALTTIGSNTFRANPTDRTIINTVFVPTYRIIETIFDKFGYAINTDLAPIRDNPDTECLNTCNLIPANGFGANLEQKLQSTGSNGDPFGGTVYTLLTTDPKQTIEMRSGNADHQARMNNGFYWIPNFDGSALVHITISSDVHGADQTLGYLQLLNTTEHYDYILSRTYVDENDFVFYYKPKIDGLTGAFEIKFSAGDRILFVCAEWNEQISQNVGEPSFVHDNEFTLDVQISDFVVSQDANITPLGGKVNIADNLGFETQWDFVKTFLQLHGAVIQVEGDSNVDIYTFDTLYRNLANNQVRDWSEKLHLGEKNNVQFWVGTYAQNNNILLAKSKNENDYQDVATFSILNTNLNDTLDLFTIDKLESGIDVKPTDKLDQYSALSGKPFSTARIPLFDADGNFQQGVAHLVSVDLDNFLASDTLGRESSYLINHITLDSMVNGKNDANGIMQRGYYRSLINNMLNQAKYLVVEMALNEEDIELLDQRIPIYIAYFGCYFYINKINNYIAGSTCLVELVKL